MWLRIQAEYNMMNDSSKILQLTTIVRTMFEGVQYENSERHVQISTMKSSGIQLQRSKKRCAIFYDTVIDRIHE